jgi:hypothetical protein
VFLPYDELCKKLLFKLSSELLTKCQHKKFPETMAGPGKAGRRLWGETSGY